MQVGRIKGFTRELGKAQGFLGLPVRDVMVDGTTPAMQTVWMPTPDELAALNNGAPIMVTLWGTGHPPIKLGIGDLPEGEPRLTAEQQEASDLFNKHRTDVIEALLLRGMGGYRITKPPKIRDIQTNPVTQEWAGPIRHIEYVLQWADGRKHEFRIVVSALNNWAVYYGTHNA